MSNKTENKFFIFDSPKKEGFIVSCIKKLYVLLARINVKVFAHKKQAKKKYNVAICAIFKNEGKYLKEWIEYHKVVGIDHFYLYNNNSTDNFEEVLKPYIEEGIVDLELWEKNQAQLECYEHCINDHKEDTKWIGFIDIDEFINPIKYDTIYEFLRPFEKKYGSVMVYWKMFGTSGLINRDPKGLVIEDFNVCWPKLVNIGKCFYNTLFEFNPNDKKNITFHHTLWTKFGPFSLPPINSFKKNAYGNNHKATKNVDIQINHYFTKSYGEYLEKKSKGDVYFKINPHDEEYFYYHEQKCGDTDYTIYKYLIKTKVNLEDKK